MPIFEYRCCGCGESFEKLQKSPAEDVECPRCGGSAKRTVSAFSSTSTDGSCEGGGCASASGFR